MSAEDTRSPEAIEREIRATQHEMSDTVNQLEAQFTPRNILNSLLDKADENGVDARTLLDATRRNPLALGMIAAGALWLVSDSDARPSALKPKLGGRSPARTGSGSGDDFHRGYVEHMGALEHQPNEDWDAWRRRRDHARASYLMVEPRHEEDEGSFRKRLDEATDRMREGRDHLAEQTRNLAGHTRDGAGNLAHSTYEGTRRAASQARDFYQDNPLIGGLAAAFVGAIAGSALPVTRTEEDYLGSMGSQAIDEAKDTARQAGKQAREKKDEFVEKADRQVRESGSSGEGVSDPEVRRQEFGTA